jgi:hypothetical protein
MKSMKFIIHHYLALLIAVFMFSASIYLYVFMYNSATAQMANTEEALTQVTLAQGNMSKYSALTKTIESTKPDITRIESALVKSEQTLTFIEAIEKISPRGGAAVSIVSISADDLSNTATGTVGYINTHIEIKGSWTEVLRSMHLVESLPYAISIDNVRMSVDADKKWIMGFDASVLVVK